MSCVPHVAHCADLHKIFWPVMLNAGRRVRPAPRIDMPSIQTTPLRSRTWVQATCSQCPWNPPSQFLSPRFTDTGSLSPRQVVTSLPGPNPHQHPQHFQDRPSTTKLRPSPALPLIYLIIDPSSKHPALASASEQCEGACSLYISSLPCGGHDV